MYIYVYMHIYVYLLVCISIIYVYFVPSSVLPFASDTHSHKPSLQRVAMCKGGRPNCMR